MLRIDTRISMVLSFKIIGGSVNRQERTVTTSKYYAGKHRPILIVRNETMMRVLMVDIDCQDVELLTQHIEIASLTLPLFLCGRRDFCFGYHLRGVAWLGFLSRERYLVTQMYMNIVPHSTRC